MKKESIISICNNQIIESEKNVVEITVPGSYIKKNGKCYIIYEDYKDPSPICKKSISFIKIQSPDLIIISSTSSSKTQLVLERNKRNYCRYKSEFGSAIMGIYAKYINCDLKESTAQIDIKYYIDISHDIVAINETHISVKGKN